MSDKLFLLISPLFVCMCSKFHPKHSFSAQIVKSPLLDAGHNEASQLFSLPLCCCSGLTPYVNYHELFSYERESKAQEEKEIVSLFFLDETQMAKQRKMRMKRWAASWLWQNNGDLFCRWLHLPPYKRRWQRQTHQRVRQTDEGSRCLFGSSLSANKVYNATNSCNAFENWNQVTTPEFWCFVLCCLVSGWKATLNTCSVWRLIRMELDIANWEKRKRTCP